MNITIAFYDYVAMALDEEQTDASLEIMSERGFELSELIKSSPLADFCNEWNFPKFHLLFCHLVYAWLEMGHPLNYSADPFEHKHKPVKHDYRASSNNGRRDQTIKRTEMRYDQRHVFSSAILKTCVFRELRRLELRSAPQGKSTYASWVANSLQDRSGDPIPWATVAKSIRDLVCAMWEANGASPAMLALLQTATVKYFSQINLAQGDSGKQGDRTSALLEDEHGEEVIEYVQLSEFFAISLSAGCIVVDSNLLELVVVRCFTPVKDITLKSTHRNFKALKSAKMRLKAPLAKSRVQKYVCFASGAGPKEYEIRSVSSVVSRVRLWTDTSQTGVYECFFADA